MLVCFMFPKAVGLTEGQWPMTLALLVGTFVFLLKLLVTEYTVYEWLANLFLLLISGFIYWHNGHVEAYFAVCMLVGMKKVDKEKALKVVAFIWIPMFVLMVAQALLGGFQGFMGRAGKVGQNNAYIRYSLGYTHPNVLQITVLVICMLLIYLIKAEGKKLIGLVTLLMCFNLYFFAYSVSMTGIICVTFLLVLTLFLKLRKKLYVGEKAVYYFGTLLVVFLPIVIPPFLQGKMKDIFFVLTNRRFVYLQEIYKLFPPSLMGTSTNNVSVATEGLNVYEKGYNVDSSFAYMLIYHGILLFLLFFVGFAVTLYQAYKKDERETMAVFATSALVGMQEQFLGNLSMKNFLWIFMGDYFYNQLPQRFEKSADKTQNSIMLRRISPLRPVVSWMEKNPVQEWVTGIIDFFLEELHLQGLKKKDGIIVLCGALAGTAILLIGYFVVGRKTSYPEYLAAQFVGTHEEAARDMTKALQVEHYRALLSCVVWGCFGSWLVWQMTKWFSLFKNRKGKNKL